MRWLVVVVVLFVRSGCTRRGLLRVLVALVGGESVNIFSFVALFGVDFPRVHVFLVTVFLNFNQTIFFFFFLLGVLSSLPRAR